MLTLETKKSMLSDVVGKLQSSSAVYLTDFTGVNVANITEIRNLFREKGIKMQVVKNTIIKRAFEELKITGLDGFLVGPTSLIMANEEDPIEPAKIITKFHKDHAGMLPVKVVQMDNQNYEGEKLIDLSKMPGKTELQAQIITLALGPGSNLIALLKGPGGKLAGQIKAYVEKLEKE
jgi:large subunit ribosomal protein L10